MKKNLNGFNTVSILSVSLLIYVSGSLIAPALNALAAQFPETPFAQIRMIMTSMYITIAVFALVSGKLAKVISKKTLVLVGLAIYGICGIIGANLNTVTQLTVCRLVMGVGVGLVYPQANALIVDFYEGSTRDKLLGYGSGVSNFGSMIGSIVGGSLAALSWRYNFYGFAFALVLFVLVLIGVPSTPIEKTAKEDQLQAEERKPLPKAFWILPVALIFEQAFSLVTPTNMARFYLGQGLGSPALLGLTMALITGTSFVAGFLLPSIRKLFKSYTVLFSCVFIALGFYILSQASNVAGAMIAQILIGLGNGIIVPVIFIENSKMVTPQQRQQSLSILSSAIYLGCFSTSYIQSWIGTISGNADQRFMFVVFAAGSLIAAVIVAVTKFTGKKTN